MQKITPFLWFDDNAEEAANFYVSVFKDSNIIRTTRYGKEGFEFHHQPEGALMTVQFMLNGQTFTAMNGGPLFTFNESVSFVIDCEDQAEVDHYWNALTADGGTESDCGWLKDKYGLSWQVTPRALIELISSPDPAVASRAMHAMLGMKKIIIADLT